MSQQRISGKDFYITMHGYLVHVESASLSIEDGSTVAMTHGVPNGWVDGETKAQGDIELDSQNFLILASIANSAGSWKGIDPFDMVFFAATGIYEAMKVEAFGCKLKINELLSIDHKGTEKSKYKLQYEVTDPDFIKINGVPYLRPAELFGVVG